MEENKNNSANWTVCLACKGRGKKSRGISTKMRLRYKKELDQFEKTSKLGTPPTLPKGHLYICSSCLGAGIIPSVNPPVVNKNQFPHLAIIGAGIGGVALAVA